MNTHQKKILIEKYRTIMDTLQVDLITYFKVNGIKKTHLMFYLRERLSSTQEITNVAFYEKIKNANRWKLDEVQIVLEYMNALDKKEIVASFYQLINEEVNKDIEKSPFQFKYLTSFYEEHFGLTYSSVYYQPMRWRYHLDELLALYRLIEHMEKFKLPILKS
ncbi:hypothetical protein VB796_23110 [Arcicella sp. LKC2W]|uniref:hypothetical protein n=1 Tax=Arcicella sp. LKC2W TaxID=2984198 RepID=UPI002B1FD700|nr:hypothetical protein [Arcicella sp. LKC2W]MEA5461979.1 hypothetical protein [Arcicella sp. LKC2W]